MTRIVRLAAIAALAAALTGAPAAHAAPGCLAPRADAPGGATFTITSGAVQQGGSVSFTGTGFERTDTDGLGQTLAFKLNDQVQWTQTVQADDDGRVSGSLSLSALPAADVAEIVEQACGTAWVRVLVGSSAAGDMAPSRSLHATFTLSAASGSNAVPGAATGGQLPNTGLEDMPPVVWVVALAGVAGIALFAERLVRRHARTNG